MGVGEGRIDRQTDGQTQNLPLYSTGHRPLWVRCPKKEETGKEDAKRWRDQQYQTYAQMYLPTFDPLMEESDGVTIFLEYCKNDLWAFGVRDVTRIWRNSGFPEW